MVIAVAWIFTLFLPLGLINWTLLRTGFQMVYGADESILLIPPESNYEFTEATWTNKAPWQSSSDDSHYFCHCCGLFNCTYHLCAAPFYFELDL